MLNRYAVIFSEPGDTTPTLACIDAETPEIAQRCCTQSVQDPTSLFHGHRFTIWPEPSTQITPSLFDQDRCNCYDCEHGDTDQH